MRKIAIASMLLNEPIKQASEYLKVPKDIFNDVLSEVESLNDVKIIIKSPKQGSFECNGLMRYIRRCVKKLQNRYKNKYRIDVHNSSASQKKRCLVEIKPLLLDMPNQVKAQYKDGVAYHKDGPFKGEEVHWSSRFEREFERKNISNEIKNDIFLIKPDLYRSTFHGWK